MRLICLLLAISARAAVIDYSPPVDLLGQWKVDLYDASGNERGTSSTPFYMLSPGIPATLGQKTMANSTSVVIATEQSNALSTATLQTTGNNYLSQIATNTASALTDTTATGTITAANGAVTLPAQGVYTVSISITGTFSATYVIEGQLADATWVQLPAYVQSTTLPYAVAFAANTPTTLYVSGGGYLNIRVRAASYTSGTIAVAMDGSLAQQTNLVPPGGATSALQTSGNSILSALQSLLQSILTATASPNDSVRLTYSGSSGGIAFATNPTDVFTICGSATKVVRVTRMVFTATQTTAGQRDVAIVTRSTAYSGGTTVAGSVGAHDPNDPAPTATVKAYTANPTVGTLATIPRIRKTYIGTTTTNSDEFIVDLGTNNTKPIVLRGVANCAGFNLGGAAVAGGNGDMNVTWTEDTQ